jgi:hypothetical protein
LVNARVFDVVMPRKIHRSVLLKILQFEKNGLEKNAFCKYRQKNKYGTSE